jgi:selenocysteine lyase/cysteine desulfurase
LGYADIDDGVVRVSMVHYTSLEEAQRLIAVVEEVL